MSVLSIDKNNISQHLSEGAPLLLDFYADWCGPCRMVAPIVDEIAAEHSEFRVGKINVDKEPELASKYGVFSIPTLIVFKDGKPYRRLTGAKPKGAILDLFE